MPRQCRERDLLRARQCFQQDLIKSVARDAGASVEGDGAASLTNDRAKRESRVADLERAIDRPAGRPELCAGSFALLCGRRDLFDDRPIMMIAAQLIWCTLPW